MHRGVLLGLGVVCKSLFPKVRRLFQPSLNTTFGYISIASGTKSFGESWTLDMTGNWSSLKQDTNGDGTWELDQARTHDAANEIATIAGLATHVAHDRAGNMIRLPKPDNWAAHFDLTYDAWNRLVKVVDGTSTVAEYGYDARDFRIVKKTYAGDTLAEIRHYFYNSRWQCLEKRLAVVSSGVLSSYADRQYVWGLRYVDDLVLRDRNADGLPTSGNLGFTGSGLDERLYCHQDPNWNVVALTNNSGAIVERYAYSAYGKAAIQTAAFAVRATSGYAWDSLYTGRQLDVESGLYHYRNRYYATAMGRFVNRDPIGYDSEDFNLYCYCTGNPLVYTDSEGLAEKSIAIAFPVDGPTTVADWYGWANSDISLAVDPATVDWTAMLQRLKSQLSEGDSISSVSILGHTGFGGAISTKELVNPNSPEHAFFKYLGTRMCDKNCGITLRACEMGRNEPFMLAMAAAANTDVIGWDDWYAVVPHGKEFTAHPNGGYEQTGDTHRKWDGSWLQWLGGYRRENSNQKKGKESGWDGKKGKGGKGKEGKKYGVKSNRKGSKGIKDGMYK
jgi:RHS repeat-associated protein